MKKNKGSRRKKKKNKSNNSSDSPKSVETASEDSQENNTASLPINDESQAANRRQVNNNTSAQRGFVPGWTSESLLPSIGIEDSKVISEETITPGKPAAIVSYKEATSPNRPALTATKPSPSPWEQQFANFQSPRNTETLPPSTPKFKFSLPPKSNRIGKLPSSTPKSDVYSPLKSKSVKSAPSTSIPSASISTPTLNMTTQPPKSANFDIDLEHFVTKIMLIKLTDYLALALDHVGCSSFEDFCNLDTDDTSGLTYPVLNGITKKTDHVIQ